MISIITINKNNAQGLEKTIKSVIEQNSEMYEFILIDGNSSDLSLEVISKYRNFIHKIIVENDTGPYHAMNKGINIASGNYLIFLNSGDAFLDKDILTYLHFSINRTKKIYYGAILLNNNSKVYYPSELTLSDFKRWSINHNASIICKSLFTEFGYYDLNYTLAADYVWFLKMYIRGVEFIYLDKILVRYDTTGMSSINYSLYKKQMNDAFVLIVPPFLIKLLDDYESLMLRNSFTIVRYSHKINFRLQKLKTYFHTLIDRYI